MLTSREYRLVAFENVLGRALAPDETWVTPNGLDVRLGGDDELDAWVEVVTIGFRPPR